MTRSKPIAEANKLANPLAVSAYAAANRLSYANLAAELDFRRNLMYPFRAREAGEHQRWVKDVLAKPVDSERLRSMPEACLRPQDSMDRDVVHPLTWIDVAQLDNAMLVEAKISNPWCHEQGLRSVNQTVLSGTT